MYVKSGNEIVRQPVEIGRTTNSFVEVTNGLNGNEELALDAYQRGLLEFGDAEKQADREPDDSEQPTPQPGNE